MALEVGARLGPYEIVGAIGAGGMGEVYRARDTRLDRTVAVKVLPASFAADPQLRERFDREARAISSLNHPHICTLHDVGHQDGVDYLVLEHLDGEALDARLRARAPAGLAVDEALAIGIQIASALDSAHRAGIVHRDLKPANVMITKSGAKLLDFGLAKTAAPVIATSGLSMAPTTPPNLTAQGTILGTFQYMAPEQIEGVDADTRTDIFAFGALLFEMVTGRTAFEGKTRAQLLGAILKDEPPRISQAAPGVPASSRVALLDRIVGTCLAKDPDDRWQTARDLLRELKWVAGSADAEPVRSRRTVLSGPAGWIGAGVAVLVLAGTAAIALRHVFEAPPAQDAIQFTIAAPPNAQWAGPSVGGGTGAATQVAISPDARHVVFVARTDGKFNLWLRRLGTLGVSQVPGTEDAAYPFWSADSRFVAFFAGGKLKKVQIAGGPPTVLCDVVQGRGGTWSRDNVIVFGVVNTPLMRVSSAGGTPTPAAQLDKGYGETSDRWPQFLPDGRHFLYTAVTGAAGAAPKPSLVKIGVLDSMEAVTLFPAESRAEYGSGHLLFLRDTTLMAQPFDAAARRLTGEPFPVAVEISTEGSRYVSFSVAPGGALVYAHGKLGAASVLRWFDRSGKSLGELGETAAYQQVALSRDERHVAATIATGNPPNVDVFTIDVGRNVASRLTFSPGFDGYPVWSPDSRRVAYVSGRPSGDSGLYSRDAAGNGDETMLLKATAINVSIPTSWSPDGRLILFQSGQGGPTGIDLWALPVDGSQKPFPVVQGPAPDQMGAFSPDGRWIAHVANESNGPQVYVQPFPASGGHFQISKSGGQGPQWRGDGQELFFVAPDGTMMATDVDMIHGFQAGIPHPLFPSGIVSVGNNQQYAVTKDGRRFLTIVSPSSDRNATPEPLIVVTNWIGAVQK